MKKAKVFECSVCKKIKDSKIFVAYNSSPYSKGECCPSCYVKVVLPYKRKIADGNVYD